MISFSAGRIPARWFGQLDGLTYGALIALLVASTMNGLAFDRMVLGREITIRPDQLALVVLLSLLGIQYLLGRLRLHLVLFDWIVLGFLICNFVSSMLFSVSRSMSLQGAALLCLCGAMYVVSRQVLANRPEWSARASNWVIGLGIAQAAYALTAVLLYALGSDIGGLQIGHLTEASVATKGTFWEANLQGAYLSLIALFLTVRYVWRSGEESGRLYLVGLFITGLALPLTLTRAAGLTSVLGMLTIALIVWVYRSEIAGWREKTGKVLVVAGCVLLLTVTAMNGLVSSLSRYPDLLLERWIPISWRPTGAGPSAATAEVAGARADGPAKPVAGGIEGAVTRSSRFSAVGRVDAWRRALEHWRERPILGHGTFAGGSVIQEGWWYSVLVQALYDTGLLGFSLLLWIHVGAVVYPVKAWLRNRRSPMSANLLAFGLGNAVLFVTSQFSNSFVVGLPWVFMGLSMGAVDAFSERRPIAEPPHLGLRRDHAQ